MDMHELAARLSAYPRKHIGFYPTPLHTAPNISWTSGVDIRFKREDMAVPGPLSGSKIRLAEFLLAEAERQETTHLLTVGATMSNSAGQLAAAAIAVGIVPELFLYDAIPDQARPSMRGNYLLDHLLGVPIHHFPRPAEQDQATIWDTVLYPAVEARKQELESQGHRVLIAPAGAVHPATSQAHMTTFLEILEQSEAYGGAPDFVYHATGTGGVLPAFLAAKLLTGASPRIRSIAVTSYAEDSYINEEVIIDRTLGIFDSLGAAPPSRQDIASEIDIDQRFIGADYAVPSPESTEAIKELAASDAVFLGPVYTGKGFAGLLAHIEEDRLSPGQSVVFLHTGDAINLFEDPRISGLNEAAVTP